MKELVLRVMLGLSRNAKWKKSEIRESRCDLQNPGRGWYHLYTFNIAAPVDWLYVACEEEQLVLLLMDIGAYRDEDIPGQAMDYIRRILGFFADRDKMMIIRFAYDTEGHGMQREPSDIAVVKRHIRQLAEPVERFADHVLCIQGVLIGDWGEMHGSKFLSPEKLKDLAKISLEANRDCFIAVRMPKQYRMLQEALPKQLSARLTLFNDGMFGSDTDLGTYAANADGDGSRGACWSRTAELVWQDENMAERPCGGEAVAGTACGEVDDEQEACRNVISDMKRMHIDYLNSTYDKKLLDRWKSMSVTDFDRRAVSLYDYIGARLGYRFVVRDAVWKKGRLTVKVENTGFSSLFRSAECTVIIRKPGKMDTEIAVDTDPRSWKSGSENCFDIELRKDELKGARVYLRLKLSAGGQIIYFANEQIASEQRKNDPKGSLVPDKNTPETDASVSGVDGAVLLGFF